MKQNSSCGCCSIMPFYPRGKSVSRFCIFPEVEEESTCNTHRIAPVYLNVYDLTHYNGYMYWAGIGVFHTGVEVHGIEYAFGAHENSSSGIFEVQPRHCPGFKFRRSIYIGTTYMDPNQVREFMELQSLYYGGDTYNLITKNCNHFCESICYSLTGNSIPGWVNRLARIGSVCDFMLPEALKTTGIEEVSDDSSSDSSDSEKKRGSFFSCLSSLSSTSVKEREEESMCSELLCLTLSPKKKTSFGASVKKDD